MNELLLIVLAYLIGSIPTSVWVSKYFFDFDIRDYGSGNAGATNTYRVLGPTWGTLVMIIDMLKGIAAVKLVCFFRIMWTVKRALSTCRLALDWLRLSGIFFLFGRSFGEAKESRPFLGWCSAFSPLWPYAV